MYIMHIQMNWCLKQVPGPKRQLKDSTTYDTTAEMNSETTATDTYSSEGE